MNAEKKKYKKMSPEKLSKVIKATLNCKSQRLMVWRAGEYNQPSPGKAQGRFLYGT